MNREEIPIAEKVIQQLGNTIDSRTHCKDAETCESLNHFLDTGYGVPPTLCFGIQCTDDYVSATLDLTKFGAREKAELVGRIVHFVMNELNKVKNVQ